MNSSKPSDRRVNGLLWSKLQFMVPEVYASRVSQRKRNAYLIAKRVISYGQ